MVPKLVRRWEKVFGKRRLAIGLPAYRQTGMSGHTASSAMRSSFAGAEAIEEVGSVIYWSLSWVRKSAIATNVIRILATPENPDMITELPRVA